MSKIAIILAVANNGVIGINNTLAWRLKKDLQQFKSLTTDNVIIMGRKTFESLGRMLPNRKHIIITRNKDYKVENCDVVESVQAAIEKAKTYSKDIYVIGGGEIYNQTIPFVDTIYLTRVGASPIGDTYFDLNVLDKFKLINSVQHFKDQENEYDFKFETYTK